MFSAITLIKYNDLISHHNAHLIQHDFCWWINPKSCM